MQILGQKIEGDYILEFDKLKISNHFDSIQSPTSIQTKKRFQRRKNWFDLYDCFVTLLLGQKLNQDQKHILKTKWKIVKPFQVFDQLPFSVIKFPNPDHPEIEKQYQDQYFTQQKVIDLLTTMFLYKDEIKYKILKKAISDVYLKLKSVDHLQNFETSLGSRIQLNSIGSEQNDIFGKRKQIFIPENEEVNIKEELIQKLRIELFDQQALHKSNSTLIELFSFDFSEIKCSSLKSLVGGQYLQQKDGEWYRTQSSTNDLFSLVRLITQILLFFNGFQIQQQLSLNGKYIYYQLYQSEENLKKLAEKFHLKKQLNNYFLDLFSLEPVDQNFRPIRLNNRIWKPENYNLSQMFIYLRPKIQELLKNINYKRISREVNQNRINPKILQREQYEMQDDEQDLSDQEWITYYEYLVFLNNEIQDIRNDFQLDNDISTLINRQTTLLKLYRNRNKSLKYKKIEEIKFDKNHQIQINIIEQKMLRQINEFDNVEGKQKIPNSKLIKMSKQERLALKYYKLFEQAIKVANNGNDFLQNIWQRMKINNNYATLQYFIPQKELMNTLKQKQYMCWSKYKINEIGKLSLFSPLERIQLTYLCVNEMINLEKLEQHQVMQIFCLNDQYELFGLSEFPFYYQGQSQNLSTSNLFFPQKFNLKNEIQFKFWKPWAINIEPIQQYYGENIGLFFLLLCYNQRYTFIIGSIQLIIYIIKTIIINTTETQQYVFEIINIIFSIGFCISVLISQLIIERQVNTIQNDQGLTQKNNAICRINQQGIMQRSVENDQLNSATSSTSLQEAKEHIIYIILLFITLLYQCLTIGLIFLAQYIQSCIKQSIFYDSDGFFLISLINGSIFLCINKYIYTISIYFTDFINPQYINEYENCLFGKYFILSFIPISSPLLNLLTLNTILHIYCEEFYCLTQCEFILIGTMFPLLIQKLISFIKSKKLQKSVLITYSLSQSDFQEFIEYEGNKQNFNVSQEQDRLIKDNANIYVFNALIFTFGYLSLFSWSCLFLYLFFTSQTILEKLFYKYQRPWPNNYKGSQTQQHISDFIKYFSLFLSTLIEALKFNLIENRVPLLFPLFNLTGKLMVKFFIDLTVSKVPQKTMLIRQRQKYLIQSTIQSFRTSKMSKTLQQDHINKLRTYPLYKIWNSYISLYKINSSQNMFETLSSLSESEDEEQSFIKQDKQRLSILSLANVNEEILSERKQSPNQPQSISNQLCLNKQSQTHLPIQLKLTQEKKSQIEEDFRNFLKNPKSLQLWTDQRFQTRNVFMLRKRAIIQHIELRKYLVIKKNYEFIKNHAESQALKKFKKEILISKIQNKQQLLYDEDMQQFIKKKNKYIEKQLCQDQIKTVVLKFKNAVYFGQFRKKIKYKSSSQIIFQTIKQSFDDIVNVSSKKAQEESFFNEINDKEKHLNIEEFFSLIDELNGKSNQQIVPKIPNLQPNHLIYYAQKFKSNVYKNLIEKFYDTYIFHHCQKYQEIIHFRLFQDELFTIPQIKFIQHISDSFWVVQIQQEEELKLISFLQIKHEYQIIEQLNFNTNLGLYTIQSRYYIKECNLVDNIDDFIMKGYYLIVCGKSTFVNLNQIINFRNQKNIEYTEQELLIFLKANLILIQNGFIGDFFIQNYFLDENFEYQLINPIKGQKQKETLVNVLLSMILLKSNIEFDTIMEIKNYEQITRILRRIIQNEISIQAIILQIESLQKNKDQIFIEKDLSLTYQIQFEQIDIQKQIFILNCQINFSFRFKQYQYLINQCQQLQSIIISILFNEQFDFSKSITLFEIEQQFNKIFSNQDNLDLLLNYFYCEYIICSTELQTNKNGFLLHTKRVLEILDDILNSIILYPSNLQILSQIGWQQPIFLKLDQQLFFIELQELQYSNKSFMQFLQTNQITYNIIHSISVFKRKLFRYKNQIATLQCLFFYYCQNYLQSQLLIQQILDTQIYIITKQEIKHSISHYKEDINVINFNQMSPIGKDQYFEEQDIIENFYKYKTSYCQQAIFYKFLQLLIDMDSENDSIQKAIIQFSKLSIHDPFVIYYIGILNKFSNNSITFQNMYINNNCLISRLTLIEFNKIDENNGKYNNIIYDDNLEFLWKQVMEYSFIESTLENRNILSEILKLEDKDLSIKLLKIKSIHLILHMDNHLLFQPILKLSNNCVIQDKEQLFQDSLIIKLKQIHQTIVINQTSCFYNINLKQFRCFYLLSICFSFSKKHIENINENNDLIDQTKESLFQMNLQLTTQFQFYHSKACQLLSLQIQEQNISNINYGNKDYVKYQIFNAILYDSNDIIFKDAYKQIEGVSNNEVIINSLLIIQLIIFFIQNCKKELAIAIIKACQNKSQDEIMFGQINYPGFNDDLSYLSFLATNSRENLPESVWHLFNVEIIKIYHDNLLDQIQYSLKRYFNSTNSSEILSTFTLLFEKMNDDDQKFKIPQNLMKICEFFFQFHSNLMPNFDCEFIDNLQIPKSPCTILDIILNHLSVRYLILTKRYQSAVFRSQLLIEYCYNSLKSNLAVIYNEEKNNYIISRNQKCEQYLEFTSTKINQFILIQQPEDIFYHHLIDDYFMLEILINHYQILIYLDQDKIQLTQLFKLFNNISDDDHLLMFFRLMSEKLFYYSENSYQLEVQEDDINLRTIFKTLMKQKETIRQVLSLQKKKFRSQTQQIDAAQEKLLYLKIIQRLYSQLSKSRKENWISDLSMNFSHYWYLLLRKKTILQYGEFELKDDTLLSCQLADFRLLQAKNYIKLKQLESAYDQLHQAESFFIVFSASDPSYAYFLVEDSKFQVFYYRQMFLKLNEIWYEYRDDITYSLLKSIIEKIITINCDVMKLFTNFTQIEKTKFITQLKLYSQKFHSNSVNINFEEFKQFYSKAIDTIGLEIMTNYSGAMLLAEKFKIQQFDEGQMRTLVETLKNDLNTLKFTINNKNLEIKK